MSRNSPVQLVIYVSYTFEKITMKNLLIILLVFAIADSPILGQQSTAQSQPARTKTFKSNANDIFTVSNPGISDIRVRREVVFDVQLNLETAVLRSQWRDNPPLTVKFFPAAGLNNLSDAKVLVAE